MGLKKEVHKYIGVVGCEDSYLGEEKQKYTMGEGEEGPSDVGMQLMVVEVVVKRYYTAQLWLYLIYIRMCGWVCVCTLAWM